MLMLTHFILCKPPQNCCRCRRRQLLLSMNASRNQRCSNHSIDKVYMHSMAHSKLYLYRSTINKFMSTPNIKHNTVFVFFGNCSRLPDYLCTYEPSVYAIFVLFCGRSSLVRRHLLLWIVYITSKSHKNTVSIVWHVHDRYIFSFGEERSTF